MSNLKKQISKTIQFLFWVNTMLTQSQEYTVALCSTTYLQSGGFHQPRAGLTWIKKAYNICAAFAGLQSLALLYHPVGMPALWKTHGCFLIPQLARVLAGEKLQGGFASYCIHPVKNQHDDFKEKDKIVWWIYINIYYQFNFILLEVFKQFFFFIFFAKMLHLTQLLLS